MRLNVFIAKSGYCSRRKADSLVKEGRVKVNGRKTLEPFFDVNPGDRVQAGKKLICLKEHVYLLFNKPKGVTTTLSDRFSKRKVIDFLPKELEGIYPVRGPLRGIRPRRIASNGIYPVGRLDKDSSGLLILTNDGDLCYKLTHPKFRVEKEYLIELEGELRDRDLERAKKGVRDEGDLLKIDRARVLERSEGKAVCKVVIHEGKKRHLRRLFKRLGLRVGNLKRIRIAGAVLDSLKPGKYKIISRDKMYFLVEKRGKSVRIGNYEG